MFSNVLSFYFAQLLEISQYVLLRSTECLYSKRFLFCPTQYNINILFLSVDTSLRRCLSWKMVARASIFDRRRELKGHGAIARTESVICVSHALDLGNPDLKDSLNPAQAEVGRREKGEVSDEKIPPEVRMTDARRDH